MSFVCLYIFIYIIHTSLCRTEMQNDCYQRNNPEHHYLYIQLKRISRENITCLQKIFLYEKYADADIHLIYIKKH